MSGRGIEAAARILRDGGVVAYPTEACFGLGCDPRNRAAVRRVLRLKRRSHRQGLLLIASRVEQLRFYLDADAAPLLDAPKTTWPGPLTWVLPASRATPRWLRGDHPTIAVRVTAMPLARRLCDAFGGAIVSTSANLHDRPAARDVRRVRYYFGNRLDAIVPGMTGGLANPSEIRDSATGAILRAG